MVKTFFFLSINPSNPNQQEGPSATTENQVMQDFAVSGYYWKYKLKSAKLRAVGVSPAASGVPTATIDCSINEEGSLVYQNGVPGDKYSGSYNVRYTAQQLSDGEAS